MEQSGSIARHSRRLCSAVVLVVTLFLAPLLPPGSSALPAGSGSTGTFAGADRNHPASGEVSIVALQGGGLGIKFHKDFRARGGPDLRVWLSESDGRSARAIRAARRHDLDGLKNTRGEQIYRIPDDVDLSEINSVVIWCRAFGVFFASARLS